MAVPHLPGWLVGGKASGLNEKDVTTRKQHSNPASPARMDERAADRTMN